MERRSFYNATLAVAATLAIAVAMAPSACDASLIENFFRGISDFGRNLGLGGPAYQSGGGGGGGGGGSFSLSLNARGNGGGGGSGYQSSNAARPSFFAGPSHQTVSLPVYVDQPHHRPAVVHRHAAAPSQPAVSDAGYYGGESAPGADYYEEPVHVVEPIHAHSETSVKVKTNTEVDVHNKEVVHAGRRRRHVFKRLTAT